MSDARGLKNAEGVGGHSRCFWFPPRRLRRRGRGFFLLVWNSVNSKCGVVGSKREVQLSSHEADLLEWSQSYVDLGMATGEDCKERGWTGMLKYML